MYYLGVDVGSISINAVLINENKEVIYEVPYTRHFGIIYENTYRVLTDILEKYPLDEIKGCLFTGSNGKLIADMLDAPYEVETICIVEGATNVVPGVRSIINIGGQDAMLFNLSYSEGKFFLNNFSINGPCASGTGSFIDQQAERLAISMYGEDFKLTQDKLDTTLKEFIELGLKSSSPAPVACRCTVFTKSDMIHLQNKGEPLENIIAGLHYGNAQNFISTIVGNVEVESPVIFIGGMAANRLQYLALKKYFPDLFIPQYFTSIGAIGAAILSRKNGNFSLKKINKLKKATKFLAGDFPRAKPLVLELSKFNESKEIIPPKRQGSFAGYLGIDIGSTSTKYAFIDKDGNIISKCYVTTRGKPIEVTQYLLLDLLKKLGEDVEILGIATTGSGRNVVGDFLDADLIIDEITAHSKGAVSVDNKVDTIFEIGGQDSKYIRIKDTYPIDFDMNKICAAGTGSFLHELANKLGINIVGEFQEIALSSKNPISLTERCTVFMESDLMGYLQQGAKIEDLIAGLCYAIVHNYLNRVVGKRFIGNKIMFLGGPSLNKAIVAAFERVIEKEILVPPHREVMGAYGAALLVKQRLEGSNEKPKKRDIKGLANTKVTYKEVICRADPACTNECKLKVYNFQGRKSIWGGDCGRYEVTNYMGEPCEDYFQKREEIFLDILKKWDIEPGKESGKTGSTVVGIPFALHFLEWSILWGIFFKELGFDVFLTPKTNTKISKIGVESVVTDMCFPIKVFHGHVKFLKDRCDFLFLPNVIDMPSYSDEEKSMFCPMAEASGYIVKSGLDIDEKKILRTHVYLKDGPVNVAYDLYEDIGDKLKVSKNEIKRAVDIGFLEYNRYKEKLIEIGKDVLEKNKDRPIWIISGRPYNLYDARLNLHISSRLAKIGILALPIDFIDLSKIDLSDFPRMYWGFGSKILRLAKYIKSHPNLFGVHITNFSCGPDSFIEHFYKFILENKPYLILEFDEHTGVAGVLTRIEAYYHVVSSVFGKFL
ncbi:acyl-CoA dehydratase activase [Desulfothermus sp.]